MLDEWPKLPARTEMDDVGSKTNNNRKRFVTASFTMLDLLVALLVAAGIFGALVIVMRLKPARGVCVVVLGDFGRSPRMQYHALSLAAVFPRVDVVAYQGLLLRS